MCPASTQTLLPKTACKAVIRAPACLPALVCFNVLGELTNPCVHPVITDKMLSILEDETQASKERKGKTRLHIDYHFKWGTGCSMN